MQNDDPSPSADLLRRFTAGDQQAAAEIFARYVDRLTHLARSRLAAKLASRVDPEDIVMSAYRSFFVAARDGRFELHRGGDLWRLLVEVTLHKLYRAADRHFANRRSIHREVRGDASAALLSIVSREPTPDDALAASEELTAVLSQLVDRDRQALELRLQGYEHEEIADRLKCSERTVRRALSAARRLMTSRGGPQFIPTAARKLPSAALQTPSDHCAPDISALHAPLKWSDFLLQEQIGAGSTGKVYRALRRSTGAEVAIKFLRKSLVGDAHAMRRFLAEWHTLAAIRHPAIVAIRGAGRTPGRGLFLMLDLVHGQNLDQIQRRQTVSLPEAIRWVREAALAVAFAHENGVIHCDLKPGNILLDDNGKIHVTDFGLALPLRHADGRRLWAGSPAFMAPEQVDPCWGAISPATDVWGLGSVLYFLLFGHPPHTASDLSATLANVVSQTPVTIPSNTSDRLPAPVAELLKHSLAKPSADRIPTAQQLASRLSALLGT